MPAPYGVPVQRPSFEGYHPHPIRMVNMSDGDASLHLVRDILNGEGSWRWTGQRPAVKVRIWSREGLKYSTDFTLPDVTFKDTGPVSIAFYVNDHLLDRVRYATPGYKHFEKAVPAGWLTLNAEAIVGAEIDKMWVSKDDGTRYGFIVSRIGLTQ